MNETAEQQAVAELAEHLDRALELAREVASRFTGDIETETLVCHLVVVTEDLPLLVAEREAALRLADSSFGKAEQYLQASKVCDELRADAVAERDRLRELLCDAIPALGCHARDFSQRTLIAACEIAGSDPADWTQHPDVLARLRASEPDPLAALGSAVPGAET